jgi:hypothetical protein
MLIPIQYYSSFYDILYSVTIQVFSRNLFRSKDETKEILYRLFKRERQSRLKKISGK